MYSTRVTAFVAAPPSSVYRALLDGEAVAAWRVPAGMTAEVHEFDGRVGGAFRVSLTYDAPDSTAKTSAQTDTYGGHFVALAPDRKVVEELAFEPDAPQMNTPMTLTTELTAVDGGTRVEMVHDGVPDAVPAEDNETGARMALAALGEYVAGPSA